MKIRMKMPQPPLELCPMSTWFSVKAELEDAAHPLGKTDRRGVVPVCCKPSEGAIGYVVGLEVDLPEEYDTPVHGFDLLIDVELTPYGETIDTSELALSPCIRIFTETKELQQIDYLLATPLHKIKIRKHEKQTWESSQRSPSSSSSPTNGTPGSSDSSNNPTGS